MLIFVLLLSLLYESEGAPGCIDLKREFPDFEIGRKPTKSSDGQCPLSRTCCSREVEQGLEDMSEQKLRDVLVNEANRVRSSLGSIKAMTAIQMKTMMTELIPADIQEMLDVPKIADVIWQYTIGEITSYELTVEVAVIGSQVMFTEKAGQDLVDMTECIIRELGTHATNSFTQISAIVENILEPPRIFGYGFEIVELLIDEITNAEFPEDCTFGQLFACPKCGLRLPPPCQSACFASANNCLTNVEEITVSWHLWVDSITQLVDAMMLMKDIKIDPSDLVSPDLVQELTNDIMTSMLSVNFKKCRKLEKRSTLTSTDSKRITKRSDMSEGDVLKSMLKSYFNEINLESAACQSASNSDYECWVGDHVGDFEEIHFDEGEQTERSHTKRTGSAEIAVNNYAQKVKSVIKKIHAKVRDQRSRASIPDEYTMLSGCKRHRNNNLIVFLGLFILTCLQCYHLPI